MIPVYLYPFYAFAHYRSAQYSVLEAITAAVSLTRGIAYSWTPSVKNGSREVRP